MDGRTLHSINLSLSLYRSVIHFSLVKRSSTYAWYKMVSAPDASHLVFVQQLLDEALALNVPLHEHDVGRVDAELQGRLPPRDVLIEEELKLNQFQQQCLTMLGRVLGRFTRSYHTP